jgi:DNA/RNA-binding domain of Phe-tRNA-synthetase-like protein
MHDLIVSPAWKAAYPGAAVGILAMRDVVNPAHHAALEERKATLEDELRARFAGYDRTAFKALPALAANNAYYKRFRKTYHVQLQLESVVLKGKSIPSVAALVEAMFMAELKNQLLTAGHDLQVVEPPVRVDVADGSETYTRLNGQEQRLKAGDMYIADQTSILSSVIYGPDRRTQIRPETEQVLFTVYAPPGIDEQALLDHLQDIQSTVLLVAPEAQTTLLSVYDTD